ncbi:hypothetical protein BH09BAC5_BH09BAC5_17740 [soil metagenome]
MNLRHNLYFFFIVLIPRIIDAQNGGNNSADMIYNTKVSAAIGADYETPRYFDIKGGFAITHFYMRRDDPSELSLKWIRESYQFQYDFARSIYGVNANVSYSFLALQANLDFCYKWDSRQNNSFAINPQLGFDLGFCALRFGPSFYLKNKFTSSGISFIANLDFYFPSYTN